jgi:hypothetical protein
MATRVESDRSALPVWCCKKCFGVNESLRKACYRCGCPSDLKAPAGFSFLRADVSGLPMVVVATSVKRPRSIALEKKPVARPSTHSQRTSSPPLRKALDLSLLSKIQASSKRVEPGLRKKPRLASAGHSGSGRSPSTDSDGVSASSIDSDQQVMRAIRRAAAASHAVPKPATYKQAPVQTAHVEAERVTRVSKVLPKGAKPACSTWSASRGDDEVDGRVAVPENVRAEYRDSAIRLMVGGILSSYTKSTVDKDVASAGERVLVLVELMEKGLHSLLVDKPFERDRTRLHLYKQAYSAQIRRIVQVLRDPKSSDLCLAIVDATEDASTFARAIFHKAAQLAACEKLNTKSPAVRTSASRPSVLPAESTGSKPDHLKEPITLKRTSRSKSDSAEAAAKVITAPAHAVISAHAGTGMRVAAPRASTRKEPVAVLNQLAKPISPERPFKRRISQYLTRKAEMSDLEKWDPAEGDTFSPPTHDAEKVILQPGTSSPLAEVYIPGLGVEADAAMNEFLRGFEFTGAPSPTQSHLEDGKDISLDESADPFSALISSMDGPTDASQLESVMQEFLADMRPVSPNSLASDP